MKEKDILRSHKKFMKYLSKNPTEVVLGPKGSTFVIDGHHHALALLYVGATESYGEVVADLSNYDWPDFWSEMAKREWIYPYEPNGDGPLSERELREQGFFDRLQKAHLQDLVDDPYRSLAGIVRKKGGFKRTSKPFMQFEWARFFKEQGIKVGKSGEDFKKAVRAARSLALSKKARGLPGYKGN